MKRFPCVPKKINNMVIEYPFLIKNIIHVVWQQQENIYGIDMTHSMGINKVFLVNNYFICVDTILRMLSIINKLMKYLTEKFDVERFYFVHKPMKKTPSWRLIYIDKGKPKMLSCNELCEECKIRLMELAKYLTEEEVEEYELFEELILKHILRADYIPLSNRTKILYSYDRKNKLIAKNRFFHCLQILQSEVSKNEWLFIYNFVLDQIQQWKDVIVLTNGKSLTEGYEAAELALLLAMQRNETSMLISDKYVRYHMVYVMDINTDTYYMTTYRHTKNRAYNVPLFDNKRKRKPKTLYELFDLCSAEFKDKLIATDVYNMNNIFNSPTTLYIKNKRPKEYEYFGRTYTNMPLDKEMCLDIMTTFINKYNKLFSTNIIVK